MNQKDSLSLLVRENIYRIVQHIEKNDDKNE